MKKNSLELIFNALKQFFHPLVRTNGNTEGLIRLFKEMGWEMDTVLGGHKDVFMDTIRSIIESSSVLDEILEEPPKTISELKEALHNVSNIFSTIKNLNDSLPNEFPEILEEFPKDLIHFLTHQYLSGHKAISFHLLRLLSIISSEENDFILNENRVLLRETNVYPKVKLSRIAEVLKNPGKVFKNTYWPDGFSDNTIVNGIAKKLFPMIKDLLESLDLDIDVYIGNDDIESEFPPEDIDALKRLILLSKEIEAIEEEGTATIDLGIGILSETEGGPGVYVIPEGSVEIDRHLAPWHFQFLSTLGLSGFQITKDGLEIFDGGGTAGEMKLFAARIEEEDQAFLIGSVEGTRVEAKNFHINAGLFYNAGVKEAKIQTHLDKLSFVLMPGDGDAFLKSILPKNGASVNFDLTMSWSNINGFYFEGSSGLDVNIPVHKQVLGTLDFRDIKIKIDSSNQKVSLIAAPSAQVAIGPLTATIEEVGLGANIAFPEDGGNLGLLDLKLEFQPPKKIGVNVDSEIVSGGGFLALDADNHQYSGVIGLKIGLEKIEIDLSAIGLINTKLPNNQAGFSMLVSINAIFNPGIQLAFGFTLNGVGGLVGIHRTMKVDVLKEKVRNGDMKSIMFPEDVIKNSAKIISDLRSVFPAQKDHYVVAPFFKIGYGTPTVLEVDLGILVELPFSDRVLLLGSLSVYLPNKDVDKRLGELHADIVGDFNFGGSYVLVEGKLRDSEIAGISLSGGFAFMLDWGDTPQFLLSLGGYHPRYKRPEGFPDISRLTALIKRGSILRLSCEYYQAITSNSYQIGLAADILVKKSGAKAVGFLGFNALFQFDPFYFDADIRISAEISYKGRSFMGVDLNFLLSGPRPWKAQGYFKVKILWISYKFKFNESWGGRQEPSPLLIESDEVLDRLANELQLHSNWSTRLPAHFSRSESLKSLEEVENEVGVFMHPSGYLELRQKFIPLDKDIQKLGNSYLTTKTKYQIVSYSFGSGDAIDAKTNRLLREYFSRGQFEDLNDQQKLSTPDFDLMPAGIELFPEEAYDISNQIEESSISKFEDIILEEGESISPQDEFLNWQQESIMNIALRHKTREHIDLLDPFGVVEELPYLEEKTFKILSKDGLTPPETLDSKYFMSYSEANDFLKNNWPEQEQYSWQILEKNALENEEPVFA